jgi:hypothetical protein
MLQLVVYEMLYIDSLSDSISNAIPTKSIAHQVKYTFPLEGQGAMSIVSDEIP